MLAISRFYFLKRGKTLVRLNVAAGLMEGFFTLGVVGYYSAQFME